VAQRSEASPALALQQLCYQQVIACITFEFRTLGLVKRTKMCYTTILDYLADWLLYLRWIMKQYPTVALSVAGLGAVALLARSWELRVSFEPNGLHIFGTASAAVIGVCVLMLILTLYRSQAMQVPSAVGFPVFFRIGGTKTYSLHMLATVALVASGITEIIQAPYHYVTHPNYLVGPDYAKVVIPVLAGALSIFSGVGLLPVASRSFLGKMKNRFMAPLLLPAFTGCFWLLSAYQRNAANPNIWEYVYQLLGIVFVVLALYYLAASSFERIRAKLFFITGSMAAFFCVMLQSEQLLLAARLRYLGMGLLLLLYLANLEFNIKNGFDRSLPGDETETGAQETDCDLTAEEILVEYKRENEDGT